MMKPSAVQTFKYAPVDASDTTRAHTHTLVLGDPGALVQRPNDANTRCSKQDAMLRSATSP
eukprot:3951048-Alexandrium_andersonii.AAC.1